MESPRARKIMTRSAACAWWQAYLRAHLTLLQNKQQENESDVAQTETHSSQRDTHHDTHDAMAEATNRRGSLTRTQKLLLDSASTSSLLQAVADVGFCAKEEYYESHLDAAMNHDKIKKLFEKYDSDQSESIDGDEMYSLLRDLGHL